MLNIYKPYQKHLTVQIKPNKSAVLSLEFN